MPAGPDAVAGAVATLAKTLDSVYNRIADWAERQSLAPASAAGISLIFGFCAAAWFTAGTLIGNLYGAIALAAGYLVTLGSREFLGPALPADFPASAVAGGSAPVGLVAGTSAARSAWLTMLGARLSEYAVYVGLAIGAAAEGWRGVWPLTIAVLGLAAVCDTMALCSRAVRPSPAVPGRPAPARRVPNGARLDDTVPDVPAWDGTAPDVSLNGSAPPATGTDDSAPDVSLNGSAPPASATPTAPHDELPRPGQPGPASSGPVASGDPEQDHPGHGGLAGRILLTALAMPSGGRVLLIALFAPVFGAQPTLVGLLDWGIIGVAYGIGSRTVARRRDRKADRRDQADLDAAGAHAEPGRLAVVLQPARPAEIGDSPPTPVDDPQLPVVRIARPPSGTTAEPTGPILTGAADRPVPDLAGAADRPIADLAGPDRAVPGLAGSNLSVPGLNNTELTATSAAFDSAALAGEPSVGAGFGRAYPGEKGSLPSAAPPVGSVSGGPVGSVSGGPVGSVSGGPVGSVSGGPVGSVPDGPVGPIPGGPVGPISATPARPVPNGSVGHLARSGDSPASGLSLGSPAGGGGPSGLGAPAAGSDDGAVYDWADEGWTDIGADADQGGGQPTRVAAAGPGAATPAELSDQDEWDAELAAARRVPADAEPGAQGELGDYPPPADHPTLAERLGLGRHPVPPGSPGPDGDLGRSGETADTAEYADPSGGSAAALAGQPRAAGESGAAGTAPGPSGSAAVLRNRDDGMLARWFGSLVRGQLMPLPPALLALAAVAMLADLGLRDLPGLLILAPALVMLVAAPGASHQHDGRFDWLAPAVLQGAQYVYIGALGFAVGVPAPITFLLCAAVALHYADLGSAGSPILLAVRRAGSPQAARRRGRPAAGRSAARPARPRRSFQRHLGQARTGQPGAEAGPPPAEAGPPPAQDGQPRRGRPLGRRARGPQPPAQRPPATEVGMWMGWEGRMIVVGLGAAMGIALFAYLALAGYLSWLICCKVRSSYLGLREGDVQ